MSTSRVDLFTTIHKGVRSLLFETALEAARIELTSNHAVDLLDERIHRTLAFIDEHERHEDEQIVPVIALIDADLHAMLVRAHVELDAAHHEVARRARALALAPPHERSIANKQLLGALNRMTGRYLAHLDHEETTVNAVLWGALGDHELATIRKRIVESMSMARREEWRTILDRVVGPDERIAKDEMCFEHNEPKPIVVR